MQRDVIIFQKSNWKLPFCHIQISFSVYTSIELSDWKIMGWVFRGLRTMCLIPSLINLREAWASISQEEFCHTQISTSAVIDESCIGVSGDSGRCALSLIIPCNLREVWASLSQEALVRTRAPHTAHHRTLTYWPNPWFISHYTRWRYTQKLRLEYGKVKVCTE